MRFVTDLIDTPYWARPSYEVLSQVHLRWDIELVIEGVDITLYNYFLGCDLDVFDQV